MKELIQVDRICWAVDPFAERVMLQRAAAWAIHELDGRAAAEIQPIYVVNDWAAEAVPQRLARSFLEKMEAFGNDSLQRIVRGIPLANLKPLRIISRPFESVEQGVRELVSCAETEGLRLIVASTRAGTGGSSPFSLPGSFVEALTTISELPVLTVNPRWRRTLGIPSIFFPSDLSEESFSWFSKVLEFAKAMGSKVTLFHKIDIPLSQPFEVATRIFPELKDTLQRKAKASQAETKRWIHAAKREGVPLSTYLDSRGRGSLSEALLPSLERSPGAVVIAPPVSRLFPRSTIQKIIRRAPYPVMILPERRGRRMAEHGARAA